MLAKDDLFFTFNCAGVDSYMPLPAVFVNSMSGNGEKFSENKLGRNSAGMLIVN